MSKLIVVSLIGVPASGKTSFGKKLMQWSTSEKIDFGVVHISFDDTMQIDYQTLNDGDYRKSRMRVLIELEKLLESLKEHGEITESVQLKITSNLKSQNLIIIDDTMHYRSMRRQIRALCRRVECEYFQIFFDLPLSLAIARNAARANQVPESVVKKLFEIMEKPQNERTIWIDQTTTDDELKDKIINRMKNPENLIIAVNSKTPQEQSLIHQADLMTRKLLNIKIKSLIVDGKELSIVSQHLNQARKKFIEDLRQGRVYADDVESLELMFESCLKLN